MSIVKAQLNFSTGIVVLCFMNRGVGREKNLLRFWVVCGLKVEDCGGQVGNWSFCCVFIDLE